MLTFHALGHYIEKHIEVMVAYCSSLKSLVHPKLEIRAKTLELFKHDCEIFETHIQHAPSSHWQKVRKRSSLALMASVQIQKPLLRPTIDMLTAMLS